MKFFMRAALAKCCSLRLLVPPATRLSVREGEFVTAPELPRWLAEISAANVVNVLHSTLELQIASGKLFAILAPPTIADLLIWLTKELVVIASRSKNNWRRFRLCISYNIATTLVFAVTCSTLVTNASEVVFPGVEWDVKAPAELGLGEARLAAVAQALGSRGCAIKNGYVVKSWGAQDVKGDLYSSAKPVLSTLLMYAVKEGKIKNFDERLVDFGWPLVSKDRTMTLRHLASMTSGYARPELPGKAWAYNDYAIQLYQQTLFDKVFKTPPEIVFHDPQRFGALQLQDRFSFRQKNRRMSASVRDFARIAWFWLNRGNWNGQQLLPRSYFDDNMRPQVPKDLALSSDAPTNDYLHIGTYGVPAAAISLRC